LCSGLPRLYGFVEWAYDGDWAPVQHMRVDLGRADVLVAQEFLDRADVVAAFEQVSREAVTEAVAGRALRNASVSRGDADRALHDRLMKMMAPPLAGRLVDVGSGGRKHPLP
jgi:hypothetical protein